MRTRIFAGYAIAMILLILARPWLSGVLGESRWRVLAPTYITLVTLTLAGLLLHYTRVSKTDVYMVGVALLGGFYPVLKTSLSGVSLIVVVSAYALALGLLATWLSNHRHLQKKRGPGSPE